MDSYLPGTTINLAGYTSTSKSIETAIIFSLSEMTEGKFPVVF